MRIIFSLLIIALPIPFLYAEAVYGQALKESNITCTVKGAAITDVFSELNRQTGFHFFYDESVIADVSTVTIHIENGSMDSILRELTRQTGLQFKKIDQTISVSKNLPGVVIEIPATDQTRRQISGIVTDESGEPVIGANIVEKGTTNGTITDMDGRFTLSIEPKALLVISYIGYITQEVEVGDQITLSVALGEDSQSLDEVVVVGYGTVRKRDLTGAISRISQDDIKNSSQGNILGRMQGRVAGVSINNIGGSEPGGGVSVQVRGISTFRDIDPLYIVDGIPVPNLNVINPNEIESLEVLKDASSSAIYGSRAAHGVVLVTTKKGRSDHQLITLNTYWGLTTPYNLPRMANADQYYDMVIEAYRNGGGELPATLEYMRGLGGNTDWWRELTDNSLMQNYDLGISGGSGKLTYSSNLGYRKEDGIILNTGYQRYSYRLNTEYKYNEAITIGSNVGVSKTIDEGVYTNVGQGQYLYSAYILDPLTPIYNPNADPTDPDYEINQYMNSTINTYASNPLSLVRRQTFTDDDLLLLGNLYADIKIYKGLSFTTNLGLNISNGQTKGFIKRYYHSPSDNRTNAQVREQIDKGNSLIWNNLIKYNRKTGLHAIDFVGGQTVERTQGSWVTAIREGTPSNAETNQVLSAATVNDQASGSIQESVLLSYLARVNYNYADKYLLTASIRRDGSSRFHKSNRWGTFPSFSAGWRITEETFFKNLKLDFITDVKFRAGWGATGNQQIADNAYLTLVGGGNEKRYVLGNPKAVYQGYGPSSTGNPDIKWETTTQTNIGADIMLWRNLSVTLDYYAKNTKDLLMQVPLPLLSGYPNDPWVNAGSIRNKGFEFAVSYDRYDMPLKHSIAFNVSTVSTEVTSLAGDQPISGTYSRSEVGKPFGQFYGYVMDGVFQSQAQIDAYTHDGNKIQPNALPGDFIFRDIAGAPDTDGNPTGPDGVINDNDRTFIGSPYPDFTFGLNISLEYKNIDFSMLVQGQYGNDVYYRRLWEAANGNGTYNILAEAYENAWRGEGTSNSYARFTSRDTNDNFRNSSWFVHDGSYIRIKNMQLGYSIPKSILSKTGLGKCRFYVSGTNLLTLTKYPGRDPEIGNRNPMSVGVDTDIYPQTRVFTGGIEIEF